MYVNVMQYYYRPQTKFAKVMFSQVSVCPRREGACMAGGMRGRGMCRADGGGGMHGGAGESATAASGTHLTGMHSCLRSILFSDNYVCY